MENNQQTPAERQQGINNQSKDTDISIANQQPDLFSDLKEDISDSRDGEAEESQNNGLLQVRKANKRMRDAHNMPIPLNLFLHLIYQGEITILFADTGIGKSIYAVQIALAISKTGIVVLVIDLELSDKQFESRYSDNYNNPFDFPDNFHVAVMSNYPEIPDGYSYEEAFIECVRQQVIRTKASFIVVDNMTKLVSADTDRAQDAKPLMDSLIELKREFNLTMLLLEHTRKTDMYRPISLNDLQGSKFKVNFCDSAFSIGRSAKDVNYRYIKQLKCRSTEITYDEDNIMVCEVVKENSFLHFKPVGYGCESEHLKKLDDKDKNALIHKVKELSGNGKSQRDIANELNISVGAVNKYLKR